MANNCLVTKLKGVVDNDNLLKFGDIIVEVVNNSANNMLMGIGVKVTVMGTGTITWKGQTYTELQAPAVFDSDWNPVLSVGKYKINVPYTTPVFVFMGYMAPENTEKKPIIDPDFLKYRTIYSMNFGGNNLTKDFDIAELYSIEQFTNLNLSNSQKFYGNIAAFGNSPLTTLILGYTNITGAIEDLLAARTLAGYTYDIRIEASGTEITYNGNPAGNNTYHYNGSDWEILS